MVNRRGAGLRVCMSLCAVLLLCELGSLSAASEKLSAREAAMAGSHHDAMPGGVPAAAGDESLQAEEEAEEASTDSEGSEGGEEGNDGEDNEGAREQGDVDAEIPAENLGDDDVDDANGGGLPPMEEEHAYFALLDTSQDGVLSPAEFRDHLRKVSAMDQEHGAIDDMTAKNLTTIGQTVGKMWVELHGSDAHESAFAEIDANGDGKLTWDEWVHEMFHDEPQEPVFVDGEDGDIFTEELMMTFDKDGDKQLNFEEVRDFVGKHMRREDVDAEFTGKQQETERKGGMGMTYLFMIEFDQNHDNKVSVDEWNDGFQGQAEEAIDRPGIGEGIVA